MVCHLSARDSSTNTARRRGKQEQLCSHVAFLMGVVRATRDNDNLPLQPMPQANWILNVEQRGQGRL